MSTLSGKRQYRLFCSSELMNYSNIKLFTYLGQSGISSFYCSLKYQLERQQISAMNKLWCISPCIQQSGQEHHMCK